MKTVTTAISLAALMAVGVTTGAAAQDRARLGHVFATNSPVDQASKAFAQCVGADAGISVTVFPDSQLGSDESLGRDLSRGSLEFAFLNPGSLTGLDPLLDMHYLPYIVSSFDEADKVFYNPDGVLQTNLRETMARHGMNAISFFELEFRAVTNSKQPVETVEDMQGLRLRAMDRRDLVLIEAFGAAGVQVAWEETPQALQTGIASGYLNPPLAPVLFGHGAYLRYFTDLRIAPAHRLIMASRDWLESLDGAGRAAAETAFAAGRKANRDWSKARFESDIASLRAYGIEIISLENQAREAFKAKARTAYGAYAKPEIIEKALAFAEKASL